MAEIASLNHDFGVDGRVHFEESALGGPVVRLRHGHGEALVALHGAQVLNWLIDGRGLLWLSSVARIREGRGIRGGIPVCWPWFADHPNDAGKPAHGFVRHRVWHVIGTSAGEDGVALTLGTTIGDRDRALWPHAAKVRVTVKLGGALSVALETTNTGQAPFQLTEALHTYFRVSDIAEVSVSGLEECIYLDKLDGFASKRQDGPIRFAEEVDRIYQGDTTCIRLADAGTGHAVEISSRGSRSTVVWNPWTDKTARLGDMGAPDAFRQMVCVETANAGSDIVTVAPGATHSLTATYGYLPQV